MDFLLSDLHLDSKLVELYINSTFLSLTGFWYSCLLKILSYYEVLTLLNTGYFQPLDPNF